MATKEFMNIDDASVYLEELKRIIAASMTTFTVNNQNLIITGGVDPTDDDTETEE